MADCGKDVPSGPLMVSAAAEIGGLKACYGTDTFSQDQSVILRMREQYGTSGLGASGLGTAPSLGRQEMKWHTMLGADDLSSGPEEGGLYTVTIEPKDATSTTERRVVSALWVPGEGFRLPVLEGYRVLAWCDLKAYDGPTPRLFMNYKNKKEGRQ